MANFTPARLENVLSLPDILDVQRFMLYIPDIPGFGRSDTLAFKLSSFSIPGTSNEAFDVNLGGGQLNFRGRRLYANTMSATFYEDSKVQTLKPLRTWLEYIAGSESGNSGGYIDGDGAYSRNMILCHFDTTGKEVMQHKLFRCFPQDVPEVSLSAESSAPMQVTCSFRYTYFTSDIVDERR